MADMKELGIDDGNYWPCRDQDARDQITELNETLTELDTSGACIAGLYIYKMSGGSASKTIITMTSPAANPWVFYVSDGNQMRSGAMIALIGYQGQNSVIAGGSDVSISYELDENLHTWTISNQTYASGFIVSSDPITINRSLR